MRVAGVEVLHALHVAGLHRLDPLLDTRRDGRHGLLRAVSPDGGPRQPENDDQRQENGAHPGTIGQAGTRCEPWFEKGTLPPDGVARPGFTGAGWAG